MRSAALWMLVGVILAGFSPAIAQTNLNEEQGLKPYGSGHGGDLDTVSLTSGGLNIHIPVASFPQRGSIPLDFSIIYSNKTWSVKTTQTGLDLNGDPIFSHAWDDTWSTGEAHIGSSLDWGKKKKITPLPSPATGSISEMNFIAPDGGFHAAGFILGPTILTYPIRSLDGTGLLSPDENTLVLSNGTRYTFSTRQAPERSGIAPDSATDTNGNQILISASGWTDTMGKVIPATGGVSTTDLSLCPAGTTSAANWIIPGVAGINGRTRTFVMCYGLVTISTNFQQSGVTESGTKTEQLMTALVLPDHTSWTFAYDSYGDLTRLGLPTGGSISYDYGTFGVSCAVDPYSTGVSRWVTSRTVDANDGNGGQPWHYNYGSNGQNPVVTVSAPDGNDTVHTMANQGNGCGRFEVQSQVYQGAASGGILLKTVATQYQASSIGTPEGMSTGVLPTQVTTTLSGGQSSRSVVTYDSGNSFTEGGGTSEITFPVVLGNVLQRDEYDFSNALVHSTVNHYLWQDNATYLTSNLVSLPVSSILKDSTGCEVAKTSNGYDETFNNITLQSSGVTTQVVAAPWPVRGNRTSSSSWLISGCAEQSAITSHSIPYDTGFTYQTFDPLGHFSQYTYAPAFLGAYLTQTNLPDTQMPDAGAAIVHHIISGGYDFNTGLLTSFTDENAQPYSYQYDVMLRLTQGNHPDGGQTKFLYPDPNTVERQRLISTTYDDYKVKFDGLGRPYQTQQLTPDCASYIKIDTTYDSIGRTKTVSNPYCLTSESTYGITQSEYDALSRTTKTIKQDYSFTSVKYEDTPFDTSGGTQVCTTATDESGKKRQACADAFGRLVKVVEPNPGATATSATGSVTIGGSEQTANSQPALPASVTVSVSGSDGVDSHISTSCLPRAPFTCTVTTTNFSDSGNLQATVITGGSTIGPVSVPYSATSTSASLAAALASGFSSNPALIVSYSSGSSSLTITTSATGSATNSSTISTSLVSTCVQQGNTLCAQGWQITPTPSANFTGGQNASSTPDTGNVTITVNGTPYATSFGAGDTPTSIASRLATAITAGPYATATASGGMVNLVSKSLGTAGDFSLSASYTWNSTQFTNPSFTTSTSGSSLSGALDASGLNNNPFVTTYQYNTRGDLLCVHQKATDTTADVPCAGTTPPVVPASWRQRFFTYDSLSRLLTAMNPETNSTGSTVITYGYANNNRVTSKTEPEPNAAWGSSSTVTVNYTYDALNRLLDTTSSDGTTLTASHRYDYATFQGQSFTNPIGREVAAFTVNSSGSSVASTFASYDVMGRVANTVQCNPGVTGCKTFTANYDNLGDLTSLGYPGNGFTVTYGYDSAARLTTATDSNGVIYAQTPTYLASGAIQEFTSPNFANNKYHVNYNNRLQPTEIWTGIAQGSAALFDKQYSYGTTGSNNGNIYTITNVKDFTRTQSFTYDPLNRLVTAGDNGHWANSYTYDAWGNLTNKTPGSPAGENMNQPADTNNHLSGLTYDAAGNVINDGLGGTFVFDGENRVKTAGSVTYTYDADGRRIQKSSGTNYWYGPGGNVFAETDSGGNWTNYIFFKGQRLARNVSGDIKYYITDHLHSTAMFVDKAGTTAAILDDNDMYPWGGVVPGVGKTTSTNTVKFTGKYRDTDTAANLDYFGARYYSSTIGRFMSVDPARASIDPTSPQTWNRYSYAQNSPLRYIDQNGMWPSEIHDQIYQNAFPNLSSKDLKTIQTASRAVDTCATCQLEANAYQHWMRAPGESIATAAAKAQSFIIQNVVKAAQAQADYQKNGGKGFSKEALTYFGTAAHTVSDSTSPAHEGFQIWGNPAEHPQDAYAHTQAENSIQPVQMQNAVGLLKQLWIDAFGLQNAGAAFGPVGSSKVPDVGTVSGTYYFADGSYETITTYEDQRQQDHPMIDYNSGYSVGPP
jgi:RHS repeat-associated protein